MSFSSDPATASEAKSGSIAVFIWPIAHHISGILGVKALSWNMLDTIIRKCAHIFNYSVLSLLCCNAFYITLRKLKFKYMLVFSWILATVFSVVDEFYQTFIPGRSGQFWDVCIDNIGVLFGISIVVFIFLLNRRKNMKEG